MLSNPEFWVGKRVLVTGAGGFIGSHLTERLAELKARVRALVHYRGDGTWGWLERSPAIAGGSDARRLSAPAIAGGSDARRLSAPAREQVEVIAGDICDRDTMRQGMEGTEVVFHLAALIAIPYSYRTPQAFLRTNVEGTLNLLQCARELNVGRFIQSSTSEVYGTARRVPIDESHPLQAQSPYAASKIAADKLVESFHLSYGLPAVTVRPFNTFGPRQSARAVIPTIITQCLTDERVKLGNVAPVRDFNYVGNVVEGFLRAGESPRAVGRTFNLGSGREIRIDELARTIAALIGKQVRIETEQQRVRPERSEVERLLADATQAREILGWEPEISLQEGLKKTIDWIEENLSLYRLGAYVV